MQGRSTIVISLLLHALAIGIVSYILIIATVSALPHFPLAGKRNFKLLLRTQMSLDQYDEFRSEKMGMLVLLGSSTFERGINENTLDSALRANHLSLRPSNSAAMGMFARMNVNMLRIMLASGIRPQRIVYGFFSDELNGASKTHDNTIDSVSAVTGLKSKSLINLLQSGPEALSTMLNTGTFSMYNYMLNHAFNETDHRNLYQQLIGGSGAPILDSSFQFDRQYFQDLVDLVNLCRDSNIPLALCNTPIRPNIKSVLAFPYAHRLEAYRIVEQLATSSGLPLWNADADGLFGDGDFADINHVNAGGATKFARILGERITEWYAGTIHQDVTDSLPSPVLPSPQTFLVRRMTTFTPYYHGN
ncbi:MAG: hypothetical protein Q8916_14805 [Bacteroidota bacterium]|nr:hypothetical protein [Bacteroidota bacterium]MDP4231666.1 hypothetical protein [Bacteroidota bacterium]MDP4235900.1 hypothetical protein [Bacteroidota bacterium]